MNNTWQAIEDNAYWAKHGDIMCRDCGRVFDTQTDFISMQDQCPSDDCPSHEKLTEKGSE